MRLDQIDEKMGYVVKHSLGTLCFVQLLNITAAVRKLYQLVETLCFKLG